MPASLLPVNPSMIISAPSSGDASLLFDGDTNTFFFPGWNSANYPATVVVDLQNDYNIEKIRIQDFEGMPTVQVSLAQSSQANIVSSPPALQLDGYGTWHEIPFNNTTANFVIIELLDVHSDKPMGQIEIIGELSSTSSSGSGGSGGGTGGGTTTPGTPYQIPVTNTMVSYSGTGDANFLFDGDINTFWFPGWNPSSYPAKVTVNLQSTHTIEKIRLYDNMGQPVLRVSFYGPTINDLISGPVDVPLDGYQLWKDVPLNVDAQFVTFELMSAASDKPIGNIEIHGFDISGGTTGGGSGGGSGSGTGGGTGTGTNPTPSALGAANVIGANSFHWVPMSVVGNLAWVREYQYWTWMEATPGFCKFEPTAGGNGNYDTHYTQLKAQGVTPIACINTTPTWMNDYPSGQGWNFDHKPKPYGSDGTSPQSYQAFARFLFQLAARYGRETHPPSDLTIDTASNTVQSGMDLLDYIEVWNEPDKWWKGPEAEFSPAEFAAMLSACYDGHQGQLGPGHGIKTADPSMKVIMGGLSTLDTDYIVQMDNWFTANRTDGVFCSEALNFHHYSNSSPSLRYNGFDEGISPEDDNLKTKLEAIKTFRDNYYPNKEVWISELGYDSSASGQSAKNIGTLDMEEVQARWIVRTCLESIASGVDRIFIYNLTDTGNSVGLYNASGLAESEQNGFALKPSWYRVMDLLNNINGKDYMGNNCVLSADARMYAFGDQTNNTTEFLYGWSPTSNDDYVSLFQDTANQIKLDENPKKIDISKGTN